MQHKMQPGFHAYNDATVRPFKLYQPKGLKPKPQTVPKHFVVQERELSYRFYAHFHPYVTELVSRLVEKSVRGLQDADTEYSSGEDGAFETLADGKEKPVFYDTLFDATRYNPSSLVDEPYPVKELDFTSGGAYSAYNWELFYHVPLTIAIHLSKNQRFQDAQRWLHFIFDPTDDSDGPAPDRFWKVRPFHYTDVKMVEDLLVNLSTGADPELREQTINSIGAWKDAPFRPHGVARHRQSAYMFKAVMAYLDNLVAWGDSLFRQDTRESINEATQLYVLAANILGPRPQPVPKKGSLRPQTYANFRSDLDNFGNVLRDMETDIPFDLAPHPTGASDDEQLATLRSIGNALYFCVPRNDKLLGYWDTVADRLFKIRNSLNMQGTLRQLPLFEPPIDPALLAKAAAAGVDAGAVLTGFNQPLPLVRFQFLIQKATEICHEVKALGVSFLFAMEKEDNEALAILRAKHGSTILKLSEVVRYGQWQETIKARQAVQKSLLRAVGRYTYYERLLGTDESEIEIPKDLDELDLPGLDKLRLRTSEPGVPPRDINVDIATDAGGAAEGRLISSFESEELGKMSAAQAAADVGVVLEGIAATVSLLPMFGVNIMPFGTGGDSKLGGENIAQMHSRGASVARGVSARFSNEARRSARVGGYARREQEWAFQSNVVAAEMTQLYVQLRGAQIREAVAEREWRNHQQQVEHAGEIEEFLTDERKGKKTNQGLYAWMKRETKGLYGQCYEFAYDVAKKAERALQHELGDSRLSYVQFGYLSGNEGLLAGEKLYLDLKRMEMAFNDLNRREYELTKNVSVLQLDPLALIELRTTGRCKIVLPEELFDLDCPGHYFRRIKSVALSLPAVTGPNVSVNCTLTQLKSSIRKTPSLNGGKYTAAGPEDDRFDTHYGSLQSIVTSTGQGDPGLFEANLRDERYLPFEGSGVLGEWQLRMPADPRSDTEPVQFDYSTISDVILHVRYTAREGGEALRKAALRHVADQIDAAQTAGSVRLLSVRHEFSSEWARFKSGAAQNGWHELVVPLQAEHYPFWSRGRLGSVQALHVVAKTPRDTVKMASRPLEVQALNERKVDTLVKDERFGGLKAGALSAIPLPKPVADPAKGPFKLYFDASALDDLWLAVRWGAA